MTIMMLDQPFYPKYWWASSTTRNCKGELFYTDVFHIFALNRHFELLQPVIAKEKWHHQGRD